MRVKLLLLPGLLREVVGWRRHLIHSLLLGLLAVLGRRSKLRRHLVKVRKWIAVVVYRGAIHGRRIELLLLLLLLLLLGLLRHLRRELLVGALNRVLRLALLGLSLGCVVELDRLGEDVVALAFRDAVGGVRLLAKAEEAIAFRDLGDGVRNDLGLDDGRVLFLEEV
jgi:hypothetical protein